MLEYFFMLGMTLQFLVILFIPLLAKFLVKKIKLLDFLGPVVLCYLFGLVTSLTLNFNTEFSNSLVELTVPLSIPMLLLSTDFIKWVKLSKNTIISFLLLIFSVTLVAVILVFIFKQKFIEAPYAGAMLTGVYIGGTANMSAISLALSAPKDIFIFLNASDMVCSSVYFLFLISIAQKVLLRFFPPYQNHELITDNEEIESHWKDRPIKYVFLNMLYSVVILGISYSVAKLISSVMFVPVLVLLISTFAIIASFFKKLKKFLLGHFEIGSYILLVFCTAMGTLSNLESLARGNPYFIIFTAIMITASVIIHYFLAYLFKIDADTVIITSVAGIFGPPFVGPVANALKNKEIIISGITTGLVGYALGNYFGIFVYTISKYFN